MKINLISLLSLFNYWEYIYDSAFIHNIFSRCQSDMEALEAQKKEKELAMAAAAANPASVASTLISTALPSYAPDYAAGLIAPAAPVSTWLLYK